MATVQTIDRSRFGHGHGQDPAGEPRELVHAACQKRTEACGKYRG